MNVRRTALRRAEDYRCDEFPDYVREARAAKARRLSAVLFAAASPLDAPSVIAETSRDERVRNLALRVTRSPKATSSVTWELVYQILSGRYE